MEKKMTLEERMAALEAIVNGDSVKRDMIRKAKQYPKCKGKSKCCIRNSRTNRDCCWKVF